MGRCRTRLGDTQRAGITRRLRGPGVVRWRLHQSSACLVGQPGMSHARLTRLPLTGGLRRHVALCSRSDWLHGRYGYAPGIRYPRACVLAGRFFARDGRSIGSAVSLLGRAVDKRVLAFSGLWLGLLIGPAQAATPLEMDTAGSKAAAWLVLRQKGDGNWRSREGVSGRFSWPTSPSNALPCPSKAAPLSARPVSPPGKALPRTMSHHPAVSRSSRFSGSAAA